MDFIVTSIERNATVRLSCRTGDQFIWFRYADIFQGEPNVRDVWQPRDGDWILVTTRLQDVPSWFELHPKENSRITDLELTKLNEELRTGWTPPDPIEGPNIWRLLSGDRLTWTGPSRPEPDCARGKRQLFQIGENGLAIANFENEPNPFKWGEIAETTEFLAGGREALHAVQRLGVPRVIADIGTQWTMR